MHRTRRAALRDFGLTALVVSALPWRGTRAAEPPRLAVKDPAALALDYVEDAAQVDRKKYPDFSPGSNCENCLQLQGTAGENYRPCGLFPGKLVAVRGWCKGWTPEM